MLVILLEFMWLIAAITSRFDVTEAMDAQNQHKLVCNQVTFSSILDKFEYTNFFQLTRT